MTPFWRSLSGRLWPRRAPQLSVVLIVHNMQREATRTLHTLSTNYQRGIDRRQYEVLVIENGSRERLDPGAVRHVCPNSSYHYLENPPPSPAFAINYGVAQARGEVICLMIDGACLITPGILGTALRASRALPRAVIATRYFYLGPDMQNRSIPLGYNNRLEDELLDSIGFPGDGYRLFEIATPLPSFVNTPPTWFHRVGESNCLFFPKAAFQEVGGCDEMFNIPGGGLLNYDLYRNLIVLESTSLVQLVGEGTFHQVHGGTTTNSSVDDKDAMVVEYKRQYKEIRGHEFKFPPPSKTLHFFGSLRNPSASRMEHTIPAGWMRKSA